MSTMLPSSENTFASFISPTPSLMGGGPLMTETTWNSFNGIADEDSMGADSLTLMKFSPPRLGTRSPIQVTSQVPHVRSLDARLITVAPTTTTTTTSSSRKRDAARVLTAPTGTNKPVAPPSSSSSSTTTTTKRKRIAPTSISQESVVAGLVELSNGVSQRNKSSTTELSLLMPSFLNGDDSLLTRTMFSTIGVVSDVPQDEIKPLVHVTKVSTLPNKPAGTGTTATTTTSVAAPPPPKPKISHQQQKSAPSKTSASKPTKPAATPKSKKTNAPPTSSSSTPVSPADIDSQKPRQKKKDPVQNGKKDRVQNPPSVPYAAKVLMAQREKELAKEAQRALELVKPTLQSTLNAYFHVVAPEVDWKVQKALLMEYKGRDQAMWEFLHGKYGCVPPRLLGTTIPSSSSSNMVNKSITPGGLPPMSLSSLDVSPTASVSKTTTTTTAMNTNSHHHHHHSKSNASLAIPTASKSEPSIKRRVPLESVSPKDVKVSKVFADAVAGGSSAVINGSASTKST